MEEQIPSTEVTSEEVAEKKAPDPAKQGKGRPKGKKDTQPRKRQGKSPVVDANGNMILPGENGKAISYLWEISGIEPGHVDFNDPEQTKRIIGMYFQTCVRHDMCPGLAELAVAFHTTRKELIRWLSGESYKHAHKSRELLTTAYAILNALMEIYVRSGTISSQAGLFLLKNNFEYEEKAEQIITPKTIEYSTREDLEKKYLAVADAAQIEAPPIAVEDPVTEAEAVEA